MVPAQGLPILRTALDPVRPIAIETHAQAVTLARSHGVGFHDALIIASALEAGCDILLAEDLQAGGCIESLTILNPFA